MKGKKMESGKKTWKEILGFSCIFDTLPTEVGGFSGYAQPNGSRYRLKVLPEPIKKFLCLSGLDFTQKPNFCNHQSKLLKSCGRQTLSLFHFFRLTPTHMLKRISYFKGKVKPIHPPAKARGFLGSFCKKTS